MTYKQIVAEFFYSGFRAGLCVEVFICQIFSDTFGWISRRFARFCEDGMRQMARLRSDRPLNRLRDARPNAILWSKRTA